MELNGFMIGPEIKTLFKIKVGAVIAEHPVFSLQSLQTVIRGAVLAAMSILSLVGNVLTMVAIAKDAGRTPLCTMVLHLR